MALGAIIGAVAGPVLGAVGQAVANKESKASVREQMDFQREMSNTAHQREVADLRKAGLNPVLSAYSGGASTPSGASYTAGNTLASMPAAINSIMTASQLDEQTENIRASTDMHRAAAEQALSQADLNLSTVEKQKAEVALLRMEKDYKWLLAQGLEYDVAKRQAMDNAIRRNPSLWGDLKVAADVFSSFFRLINLQGGAE